MTAAAIPPLRPFTDPDTIRLISTAYIDEPALSPLSDSDDDRKILETLEGLTSSRLDQLMPLPAGVARSELLSPAHGYGWSLVNAAFCYTRPTGNRFNGPDRGAWYASTGENALETAQREVCWHLTRELDATGVYENITDYRELIAGITSNLHDLSGRQDDPALDPDPILGYPAGQALAASLRAAGSNGILYPSVRRPDGICLAAFRLSMVQNIRQGGTWRFVWAGARDPVIGEVN